MISPRGWPKFVLLSQTPPGDPLTIRFTPQLNGYSSIRGQARDAPDQARPRPTGDLDRSAAAHDDFLRVDVIRSAFDMNSLDAARVGCGPPGFSGDPVRLQARTHEQRHACYS